MTGSSPLLPSQMTIEIRGFTDVIDTSRLVGSGGEGIVVRGTFGGATYAVKIVFPTMRTTLRFEKLQSMIDRRPPLPTRCVRPIELAYDKKNGQAVGFAMELIPIDKYDTLSQWLDPVWRKDKGGLEFRDIVSVFYELRMELEILHKSGYTIGDFNPGGVLILNKKFWDASNDQNRIKIVDADTMAFDSYPCEVYTLSYLNPLMPHRLESGGALRLLRGFKPEDDNFSFAALLFQALTTANVWDGYHPQFQMSPKINFMRGWTVLHKEVEYPDDAVPFESLPQEFQDEFKAVFLGGKREMFPVNVFRKALGLKQSINLTERKATRKVASGKLSVLDNFYECLDGESIVDLQLLAGGAIAFITRNSGDEYTFYLRHNGNLTKRHIVGADKNCRYRILDIGFVVEYQRPQNQDERFQTFRLFNLFVGQWLEITTLSGLFGEPIVGGGGGLLFTGDSKNSLVSRSLQDLSSGGNFLSSSVVKSVNRNSAIKVDAATGNVAGYIRTMSYYAWFFVKDSLSYDIPLQDLHDTENLKEWNVRFYQDRAVVLRFTDYKGHTYIRVDEVDLTKKLVQNRLLNSLTPIEGDKIRPDSFEYGSDGRTKEGVLLYPTAVGIEKENLVTGEVTHIEATKGYVNRASSIRRYDKGLLVFNDKKVDYIEL